ncbi:MAG TPA: hypothetical protein DCP32_07095 [Anaerolineaceae bacterium]|nr:hypothetical protein [Anaerolineaceae bacterium]HBA90750.1 hypothetical protein [Anaerolineaceae bacterium]
MAITKYLAKRITNYNNPNSLGSWFRKRRAASLMKMIEVVFSQKGTVNIIDIGGTRTYWKIIEDDYLASKNCKITLVNLTKTDCPEDNVFQEVIGDGRHLDFADMSFDIAHSNSVIEHVGGWQDMVDFSQELARVAERFYVQTPSFWFPVEPHAMFPLFHWLPISLRKKLVMQQALGNWQKAATEEDASRIVSSARLLTKKQMRQLFPGASINTEWFVFPKSYLALKL